MDVVARALLVGVDEDEVEGGLIPGDGRVEPIERCPRDNLDGVAEAGVRERPPGEVGPAGIEFERHDPSTGREAACEPNGARSAEGADLEDALRAEGEAEHREQPAERLGHRYRRQTGGDARPLDRIEGRVGGKEKAAERLLNPGGGTKKRHCERMRVIHGWGVDRGPLAHCGFFSGRARVEPVVIPPSTRSVCPVT